MDTDGGLLLFEALHLFGVCLRRYHIEAMMDEHKEQLKKKKSATGLKLCLELKVCQSFRLYLLPFLVESNV